MSSEYVRCVFATLTPFIVVCTFGIHNKSDASHFQLNREKTLSKSNDIATTYRDTRHMHQNTYFHLKYCRNVLNLARMRKEKKRCCFIFPLHDSHISTLLHTTFVQTKRFATIALSLPPEKKLRASKQHKTQIPL